MTTVGPPEDAVSVPPPDRPTRQSWPAMSWLTSQLKVEGGLALLSAAVALAIVAVLAHGILRTNQTHTDILGYPIFADFNANRYPDTWYLAVIGWPVLSLLFFLVARRLLGPARGLGRPAWALNARRARPEPAPADPAIDPDFLTERFALGARVAAVGFVWGLTGTIVRGTQNLAFWRDLVGIAAVYAVMLLVGSAALSAPLGGRRLLPWRWTRLISTFNALGAALTVAGLILVSERTVLTTLSDNVPHPMHWLPVSVGLLLLAVSVGAVGVSLWRARDAGPARVRAIERRALFLVAVPVTIVLLTAALLGGQQAFNTFEGGQLLVTVRLVHLGEVPYRDFLPFHGLMIDVLFNDLGYQLLSASAWGAGVGATLILGPLTWIALYLFAYRLAGSSWAAMLTMVLLLFNTTLLIPGGERLMFWPLVLLLLAVTFDRRSRTASFCTGAALVAFAVLVPEATYVVPACGIALLAHDAYHAGWPRPRVGRDFSLTLWAVVGGAVVTACVSALLVAEHAVGGFIDFYATEAVGHGLEAAIPISASPMTPEFFFWIVAPGVATLLALGILALRICRRLPLRTTDFLIVAATGFTILYYPNEFLSRADSGHAELAYWGATPLLMLCGWEVVKGVNGWARARLRGSDAGHLRWPVVYVAAVIAGITATTSLPTVVAATPTDFRATAAAEPWLPSLGYIASTDQEALATDVGTFLSAFLKPGQEIYDFSNQPGLYFYMLDYRPASTHFYAAFDYSQASQDETIADLEAHHPEFAILTGASFGALPVWDGIPDAVREYDISQYLLDHYRPFADVDGQLIYVDRTADVAISSSLKSELGAALNLTDLPFQYPDCTWGDAPESLAVQPPAGEAGVVIGGGGGSSVAWTLSQPSEQTWGHYRWIQLTIASGSPAAAFSIDDREVAGENHAIDFQTLPGAQATYRFQIGACPQWHGFSLPTLQLSSSAAVTVTQVELLP